MAYRTHRYCVNCLYWIPIDLIQRPGNLKPRSRQGWCRIDQSDPVKPLELVKAEALRSTPGEVSHRARITSRKDHCGLFQYRKKEKVPYPPVVRRSTTPAIDLLEAECLLSNKQLPGCSSCVYGREYTRWNPYRRGRIVLCCFEGRLNVECSESICENFKKEGTDHDV